MYLFNCSDDDGKSFIPRVAQYVLLISLIIRVQLFKVSLWVISLTVLADSIYNILIFFAEKMWVAFALSAKAAHIFHQKWAYLHINVNFNELLLTNDIVSFEQLGPGLLAVVQNTRLYICHLSIDLWTQSSYCYAVWNNRLMSWNLAWTYLLRCKQKLNPVWSWSMLVAYIIRLFSVQSSWKIVWYPTFIFYNKTSKTSIKATTVAFIIYFTNCMVHHNYYIYNNLLLLENESVSPILPQKSSLKLALNCNFNSWCHF